MLWPPSVQDRNLSKCSFSLPRFSICFRNRSPPCLNTVYCWRLYSHPHTFVDFKSMSAFSPKNVCMIYSYMYTGSTVIGDRCKSWTQWSNAVQELVKLSQDNELRLAAQKEIYQRKRVTQKQGNLWNILEKILDRKALRKLEHSNASKQNKFTNRIMMNRDRRGYLKICYEALH